MGKLICLLGKSSTGKDTIYRKLLERTDLKPFVTYTTRPIRFGETDGKEYHFVTQEGFEDLQAKGRVIESRVYNTIHGPWTYFTVDDIDIKGKDNYLAAAGTIPAYAKLRDYYGEENVIPVMIVVDDGDRLARALKRERKQEHPKYEEMCRRFLADSEDFSDEKIAEAGIKNLFQNEDLESCITEVTEFIGKECGWT